ncbi:ribulokinase [uncultured Chitinophaga sp.]|jgi:L-ribulokinase|uniref:ribulokinase n=1 Tax=uncultured Chitinophaga sp. TaxID=339340 RepID=UPI0026077239|nr:ribulokinase [uncultured Chitinophaga sp.]
MKKDAFVIGVDFGTDSVRSLVVNAATGQEAGSAVHYYSRWKQGLYCDAALQQYRQHPLDYLEGLEESIKGALQQCPPGTAALVKGISVDTTGSTPVAVNEQGTPLALLPGFEETPNAMFVLWKDHTSNEEAALINEIAHANDTDYTKYCGGIYSSEWFWAKILHIIKTDAAVGEKAVSWVEHCDWIPGVLTGHQQVATLPRSRCAAGHKAMWHEAWNGLPPADFLGKLHPGLRKYAHMFSDTVVATVAAGTISAEWATRLGIPADTVIGTGAFDAHMGAVGAGIQPYALCRVIGTSTCDILMAPMEEAGHLFVKGICGQVDGSVVPGMLGLEAGQSAYGDVYAWLRKLIMQPLYALMKDDTAQLAAIESKLLGYLAEQAQQLPLKDQDPLVLDWFNGRRTPDANHTLKSSVTGLHLGTDAGQLFRALVEATAFGARSIVERFVKEGVPIHEVLALGGVAKKSGYAMQVLADVLNRPIKIVRSEHACALGAAMFAAVCAGIHPDVAAAQQAMSSGFETTWQPRPEQVAYYARRYPRFLELGAFTEKLYA